MGRIKLTNVFVCPCEENEIHIEEGDFEPTYCPWCGDVIEDLQTDEEGDSFSTEEWDEDNSF